MDIPLIACDVTASEATSVLFGNGLVGFEVDRGVGSVVGPCVVGLIVGMGVEACFEQLVEEEGRNLT